MEKQMDLTESSGGQPPEKKRRGYGLLLRLIALVLVVALFVGMTSVDFSLVRYQGTDQMAAAQYLMDQTTYLQENRFERLKSLLTQLDSYSINLQAAEREAGPQSGQETGESVSPAQAPRAARALRSLGTVMRWGNVFFAGLLLFGAFVGTVLCIVSLFAAPSGSAVQLLLNKHDILYLSLGLLGVVAVFYAVCFFVRLVLRELLRIKARRK